MSCVHLYEAEPDVALADVLVRIAKERGRRNTQELLVLAEPLDEAIICLLVRLSAQIQLVEVSLSRHLEKNPLYT